MNPEDVIFIFPFSFVKSFLINNYTFRRFSEGQESWVN
jgi:hypothetical protein